MSECVLSDMGIAISSPKASDPWEWPSLFLVGVQMLAVCENSLRLLPTETCYQDQPFPIVLYIISALRVQVVEGGVGDTPPNPSFPGCPSTLAMSSFFLGPSQVSRTQAVLYAAECERETCNEGICLINHAQDLKRVLSEQKQKVKLLP